MKLFKNSLILLVGLGIGIILSLKVNVFADITDKQQKEDIPLEHLRIFSQIYKNIKNDYVEEVSGKELINNAIMGMVSGLDPHSTYLLPDAFKDLTVNTSGKFGGLGIEVNMKDGFVKVVAPIDDTPAYKAGIKSGDMIIKIDDKSVQGMTLRDAIKLMRGKVGTPIKLTIVRKGVAKPFDVRIVRDIIKMVSVKSKLLEPGFGYIRISQFQPKTRKNLDETVKKLIKENKDKKLKGIILDLRNNPGGLLSAAIDVSDAFLKGGKIVYTEGRNNSSKSKAIASKKTIVDDIPIVVIINGGSASASEIVAGALQDHKRAIIVGSKSFGKGSVQTIIPMLSTEGSKIGIKITTARYYTPNGRSIQATGIEPDIEINPVIVKTPEDLSKLRVSEKDLSGHLVNGADETKKQKLVYQAKQKHTKKNKKAKLIKEDFVLYETLNLLKGISLSQKVSKKII